jgi:DHA1 family tetracycline resistance protein-like MFS transporter
LLKWKFAYTDRQTIRRVPGAVRKSPLLPIFLIVLVDILGYTIILPLLPFYSERLGASPFVVGLLISTYAICQLISGPIIGKLSDRLGRRPLLIVSQMGTLVGFLILSQATALWLIFVSRIIDGATAGNLSLAQAYIADVTEPQKRAQSFGVIGIAFGLGFLVGPAISGFLAGFGYAYPIYAAAFLSATSIACTWALLPQVTPGESGTGGDTGPGGRRLGLLEWSSYVDYFNRPGLRELLLEFFLFALCFSSFTSGFALFAERRFTWQGQPFGAKQVGYVFAYVGFLGVILQGGLIGRLVKWLGEPKLVKSGFLCTAIGYGALGFIYRIPELMGISAVASYGTGVLRPAVTSLITQRASKQEQGVVLGLTQSLTSVAQIVAPLLSGFLIGRDWLATWAIFAGGIAFCGFLLSTVPAGKPLTQ